MNLSAATRAGSLVLRPLLSADAPLLVEATASEVAPALWGPRPAGPYSLEDAERLLGEWDPGGAVQASYGLLEDGRLLGAAGLMPDAPDSAEVAYWVRPEERRRGLGLTMVGLLTRLGHEEIGIPRLWLEINPTNEPSLRLARRAGYEFSRRLPRHCRSWVEEDPALDTWHDCLIWEHVDQATITAI